MDLVSHLIKIQLVPTARLARELARTTAAEHAQAGQLAWLPTPVYTFSAWLAVLRDEYLLNSSDERTPISSQQSGIIWQSLIDTEVFIGEPQVAGLAQRAWRTIAEHAIAPPEQWPAGLCSEDNSRFVSWAIAYRQQCEQRKLLDEWMFAMELPEHIAAGAISTPQRIELIGFDLPMTPMQNNILRACETAGVSVARQAAAAPTPGAVAVSEFADTDEEITSAANWARSQLESDPGLSVAVVVPDLSGRVDHIERRFRQVFDPPGFGLLPSPSEAWHISMGKPLSAWPLVADAQAILNLLPHRITQPQAFRLLRSPYLPRACDEHLTRTLTLAELARRAPYHLTINELQWALHKSGAEGLASCLEQWQQQISRAPERAWPSAWAAQFSQELSSIGFGNGRTLSSRDYQVLKRWHDLLEGFSSLDVVSVAPLNRRQALTRLGEQAAATVFRERNPGATVEVLGVEEALGSRFDAVWITGLDSGTWPGSTRRDPLIPGQLQAHLPAATGESCLQQATEELLGLLRTAPVIQGSFSRGDDEAPHEVTSLIECVVSPAPPVPAPVPAPMTAVADDSLAPPLENLMIKGGTGVLKLQSACPFRAFAEQRLGARKLISPRPGLDAGQRGAIIHKALEHFWAGLEGHAALHALGVDGRNQRITAAVTAALNDYVGNYHLALSTVSRQLEQNRTERIVARWLSLELARDEFKVLAHERAVTLQIGPLILQGKIDRLDELADGSTLLIDYKTGRTGKSDWLPQPRMADPQLPAYALSMQPAPGAISFARIRPEDLRFDGLSDAASGTQGVVELSKANRTFADYHSWSQLFTDWQIHLDKLAADFAAGQAAVNPRQANECNSCHLQGLCRIQERAPGADLETGEADGGGGD